MVHEVRHREQPLPASRASGEASNSRVQFPLMWHASLRGKTFEVRNVGNDWLKRPKIIANVLPPARFECVIYRGSVAFGSKNPCEVTNVSPSDLSPDPDMRLEGKNTDLHVVVYFSIPKNQASADIYFSVSGDNLSVTGPFSVTADLP